MGRRGWQTYRHLCQSSHKMGRASYEKEWSVAITVNSSILLRRWPVNAFDASRRGDRSVSIRRQFARIGQIRM